MAPSVAVDVVDSDVVGGGGFVVVRPALSPVLAAVPILVGRPPGSVVLGEGGGDGCSVDRPSDGTGEG
ncbi:hypothetical protein OG554_22665 [Streptomyces griseus]|uniref:hypothetical protein n=1 Tax=Streptomyces TaxID=1883 RepID=UPI003870DD18|nr:hypothetical protein OG554_22665 [Streptomyces fimicarius]